MTFSWDPKKSRSNERKHRVSFTEAMTAFDDPNALVETDKDFNDRLTLIGFSADADMLVVVHIEYEDFDHVRIISARKATRPERNRYNRGDDE